MRTTRVLIADAASTDRTVELAMGFAPRLTIEIITGGLPSTGRNAGAKLANSRFVLFLDADIELADSTLVGRAIDLMKAKSLHCLTTDILCPDGTFADRMLYRCNNLAQRLSRFHKPFATGMFMLVDRQRFNELGGFDEQALYAEDYQLTRQFARRRFRSIRGGIHSTNRRFQKMGHGKILRLFLTTAIRSRHPEYFRKQSHSTYWQAY